LLDVKKEVKSIADEDTYGNCSLMRFSFAISLDRIGVFNKFKKLLSNVCHFAPWTDAIVFMHSDLTKMH